MEFWKVYRSFPETENLQNELYDYINDNLSFTSQIRGFLSRIPLLSCSVIDFSDDFLIPYKNCIENFNSHIKNDKSSEMFIQYVSFINQLLTRCMDDQCVSFFIFFFCFFTFYVSILN